MVIKLIERLFVLDHPEPNSRVNARNWGVLSLMCSVIAPPDANVRKYLNSHLKRCAITDYVTEEGKFARFAEKVGVVFFCKILWWKLLLLSIVIFRIKFWLNSNL